MSIKVFVTTDDVEQEFDQPGDAAAFLLEHMTLAEIHRWEMFRLREVKQIVSDRLEPIEIGGEAGGA